jgi:hypothetical protein
VPTCARFFATELRSIFNVQIATIRVRRVGMLAQRDTYQSVTQIGTCEVVYLPFLSAPRGCGRMTGQPEATR